MYRYVLFDLDGTLTDSREGICKSVQYALQKMGIDEPDLRKLEVFIGPPLRSSFQDFYQLSGEKADRAIAFYRERYKDIGVFENAPYPGIPELLKRLKGAGIKIAVASSKPEVFVNVVLEHFQMKNDFDYIVGSELDGTRGEKEEVIFEVLRRMEEEEAGAKNNAVMVGDRHFDIDGAKRFGLDSIGVKYGFASEKELEEAGATYVVKSVAELEKLLLSD